ncbi:MAG TPA: methyltransferase domain-containing protein [Oculatellaceae cyanobacterium]
MEQTKESQYQHQVSIRETEGLETLGLTTNHCWRDDPRHLLFILARSKFVSKMLSGSERVLEVGCGDAFGARLVQQEVANLSAVDFDPVFVNDVNARMSPRWKFDCHVHNMLDGPVAGEFDAAYSLDVIEHIDASQEKVFVGNIAKSLVTNGVLIIGTPSIQSQVYASSYSKQGHINCKDAGQLKALMKEFFHNVFIFSMNDEVVHTGYYPMAHYLFALCVGNKLASKNGAA